MASGFCLDLISKEDRGLYSSLLFLPETFREAAASLYAFHLEIGKIPFLVSEPMPGEIRLQWWRDVVSGERRDEAKSNPLAVGLLETITRHQLPIDGFLRYLDAKVFDLYNDPMPDRVTLEAYLGETESFIIQMIANCCGAENNTELADTCGHSGVAIGISKLVTRLAYDRDRQRVYVPCDLLRASGLSAEIWLSDDPAKLATAIAGFIGLGKEHAQKARSAIVKLPKQYQSVFLPLAIGEAKLDQSAKLSNAIEKQTVLSPLRTQWLIWKKAILGF
ncbi:MAG: squalene/phytoene synthase family protein [Salaquimonas sp.]